MTSLYCHTSTTPHPLPISHSIGGTRLVRDHWCRTLGLRGRGGETECRIGLLEATRSIWASEHPAFCLISQSKAASNLWIGRENPNTTKGGPIEPHRGKTNLPLTFPISKGYPEPVRKSGQGSSQYSQGCKLQFPGSEAVWPQADHLTCPWPVSSWTGAWTKWSAILGILLLSPEDNLTKQ
jgi:hypothetical protein